MYNAKEDVLETDRGRVRYIAFGTGEKPLVMIPGLRLSDISGGAGALSWYYRIFAKEYRVYMFDRNESLPEPCTIHTLAEDVYEAMGKLCMEKAFVFGASQGGMIAMDLAIHHPETVEKLVLGVTASRTNDTIKSVIESWIALAGEKGLGAVAEDYIYKGYSEEYLKKNRLFIPLAVKVQKLMEKDRFVKLAKACLTCTCYDELEKIECPVLVLGGAKDRIVTGEASLEIAEKLGCECHMYENLSHEAYNEAKDFNERIYDFLKR